MKNNLLFRCWDIKLKKFNYFDIFSVLGMVPEDSKDQIQQFSGVYDMDDKPIYTGDILEYQLKWDSYPTQNGQVVFSKGVFNCLTSVGALSLNNSALKFFMVVGNIKENHNLLDNAVFVA